ncbi:tetratricopeptide repeat protein [Streptomyces violaceus]|uniref:tetratricopeptide repeat protein n=1 Tax=Streptomyces violaceus TaxID=1936 RepID=UPI0038B67A80
MAVTGYRGVSPEQSGVGVQVSATGDATAAAGGLAITGYLHQVSAEQLVIVHQQGARLSAAWPHQVGVIPPKAQSYQHRAEMDRLRAALGDADTTVLPQVPAGLVLSGMGGVGKTQLAADYARTAWADGGLDVLVWITASSRSAVVTGYAQAGIELCQASSDAPEQAARTFLAWISPKAEAKPCRWLIVLDDVGDPDDLKGLWPPASPLGRTLITTRRRDAALAGDGRRLVEVGLFTEAEAVAYLTSSLAVEGRSEPLQHLIALTNDLDRLPLALAQAAAYLSDSGESVAAYRELFADRTTRLVDTAPDRLPDDQDLPLAASWSLSIDRADSLRPVGLARSMLYLCALLDANGIPEAVLTSEPALTHLAKLRGMKRNSHTAKSTRREALGALRALHRLHLGNHAPHTPHLAVRVHQLVQRATRETLSPDQHASYARTAAGALMAAWPEVEQDPILTQTLQANFAALYRVAEKALWYPNAHPVLFHAGTSLGTSGQLTEALAYWRRMTDAAVYHLGPHHPNALLPRQRLAHWQGVTGNLATAVSALENLLPIQCRVLGVDAPETLLTRYELARWRGASGDISGTIQAYEELLDDSVRVLGAEHRDAVTIRQDLAFWRAKGGEHFRAVTELQDILRHYRQASGFDRVRSLKIRHNIAFFTGEAGDAAAAVVLFEELLRDYTTLFGPHHSRTLGDAAAPLALWRGRAGDPARAVADLEQLIADMRRVLDPADPAIPYASQWLASSQGAAGYPVAAVATLERSLSDPRRGFDSDHPQTLTSRRDLAHWRGMAGDPFAAVRELEMLLSDMRRVLGPRHPETGKTLEGLRHWRQKAEPI